MPFTSKPAARTSAEQDFTVPFQIRPSPYFYFMMTLSATEDRANMTRWLDEAIAGRPIGITHKVRIVKLPITGDWAATEYGLSGEELDQVSRGASASNRLHTARRYSVASHRGRSRH